MILKVSNYRHIGEGSQILKNNQCSGEFSDFILYFISWLCLKSGPSHKIVDKNNKKAREAPLSSLATREINFCKLQSVKGIVPSPPFCFSPSPALKPVAVQC